MDYIEYENFKIS